MKVLVTGALGFIGHHVVKTLVEAGHDVQGLDVSIPKGGPGMGFGYSLHGSTVTAADITTPLEPIEGLDVVIHLAAMANPRECDADPAKAFNANVNGTLQVLRMALASGVKKFIFSSSAHVYDIPPKYLPTDEQHPLRLNNTYTTTKILGEELCKLYYENHGLSYTVLRLYNAYGPGQMPGYFIPDMIARARKGDISLNGGNTTKDWVYVEEVAQAFVKALQTPFVGAINIGTGVETELSDVASHIAHAMGATFSTTPREDVSRMQANITRAGDVLGWYPDKDIHQGLEEIFKHEGIQVRV